MLPTGIEMVIVVIVAPTYLIAYMTGLVMINRTSLILGVQILYNNIVEPSIILQFQ